MEVIALALLGVFGGVAVHQLCVRRDTDGGARKCACAELESGLVEVSGRVHATRTVRAPISGREAVGYWIVIEQERGPTAWEPVVRLSTLSGFELSDDTGRVPIDAPATAVHADIFEWRGSAGPFSPLPAHVEKILHDHRRSTQGVLFGKAFRWREQVLEPGHEVTLRAWAQKVPVEAPRAASVDAVGAPYRSCEARWILRATDDRPMQVIDRGEGARRPFRWRRLAHA